MIAAVRALPDHFAIGWRAAADLARPLRGAVQRVVLCGMGGSAFPADLVALHDPALPLSVSRDYAVRGPLDAATLVVASSFSGNTEETLAAFADAGRRGARRVVITAGGALGAQAEAAGVPVVRLAKPFPSFQPRAATAMFVGALGRLLDDAGLIDDFAPVIDALARRIRALAGVEARAAELATALRGRIPVILATPPLGAAARVVRIKLNENAKITALCSEIPEFNHNELVGFTRQHGPFAAVILRDPRNAPRMAHRVEMTRRALEDAGVPTHAVDLPDAPPIEQAFAALYLFDFVSCRLALQDGIDPNPVALIESFKASLGPDSSPAG